MFPLALAVERERESRISSRSFCDQRVHALGSLLQVSLSNRKHVRRNSTMFQHGHHRNEVLDATFDHSFPFR